MAFQTLISCSPWVGLTLESMSSTMPRGGLRPCTRSIHWPDRSARAAKFSGAAALPPTIQRIAGSWRRRSASFTSSYPARRPNTDCRNNPDRARSRTEWLLDGRASACWMCACMMFFRPVLSVDFPRTKARRCQRLLNLDNDRLVHIGSIARVKLGRGPDRNLGDGVVLYARNKNACVPSPAMNSVGDDAVFPSLCFRVIADRPETRNCVHRLAQCGHDGLGFRPLAQEMIAVVNAGAGAL